MKKFYLLSAMLATISLTMAQELTTDSVYDTNQSGTFTASDATGEIEQVRSEAASANTSQYVTAADLKSLLQVINNKLEKLEKLEKLKSIENRLSAIVAKMDMESPGGDPAFDPYNGHDYVDLGITDANGNKFLWATCNVGATNPEDYGCYFAWGETTTKSTYDWSSYKYCKGSDDTQTKYCNDINYGDNGFTDTKTVLEASDDAATANWGGSWRMPTHAELTTLKKDCYWQLVESYNGKDFNGYVVYRKKSSGTYSVASDAHIFLPAAGCRVNSSLCDVDFFIHYWSSSLYESDPDCAWCFYFCSGLVDADNDYRCSGNSVRPVCPSSE